MTPADPAQFQRLRAAFHELVELDEAHRALALERLRRDTPELATALTALLGSFDARDLHAGDEDQFPAQIGPFRVLRRIGRGGMGEVFEAERTQGGFSQRVALKLLRRSLSGLGMDARFVRERQILARLEHASIARLIDGGISAQGQPWLAMELVHGHELGHWLDRAEPSLRQRVSLFVKICSAVGFAHRALVVHRDLKPANILVDGAGEPKLLDFGIAKLLDDEQIETQTQGQALTPRYAAPEQILGERITTATDVYALGVLLFECLCGSSPYANTRPDNWTQAVLKAPARRLRDALSARFSAAERAQADRYLQAIIDKAMARSPPMRYASADAMADDLRDWLADLPPRSGIGTQRERLRSFLARHRWPLLAASLVALALIGAATIAWREARIARAQAELADRHAAALLEVLASASPDHFAGRDPPASEFLRDAGQRLAEHEGAQPALTAQALTQIGHGLINLGQGDAAADLLDQAYRAADGQADTRPAFMLGLLKLMAVSHTGDDPPALAQLTLLTTRVKRWSPFAPDSAEALDALASLGSAWARADRHVEAAAIFAPLRAQLASVAPPPAAAESIWRQLGWGEMRAGRFAEALADLRRSRAVIDAHPDAFSAVRTAEADVLLAENAIELDQLDLAERHLQDAAPILLREYPRTHSEHRHVLMLQGLLLIRRGQLPAAEAKLAELGSSPQLSGQDWLWLRMQAEMAVTAGDCGAIVRALTPLEAHVQNARTRHQLVLRDLRRSYARSCVR